MKKQVKETEKQREGGFIPSAIELHLEYFSKEGKNINVPLATAVSYFLLGFSDCDVIGGRPRLRILLKHVSNNGSAPVISIKPNVESNYGSDSGVTSCVLPAACIPEFDLCIVGLCSVLRYLLNNLGDEKAVGLLGFHGGCLSAPAEVSTWTRFCEVDMLSATSEVFARFGELVDLPLELARFEKHLAQPVRMHNIRKRMQRQQQQQHGLVESTDAKVDDAGSTREDPIKEYARTQHVFAEGPDVLLSDSILFFLYFLVFQKIPREKLSNELPLTIQWFDRLCERTDALQVASKLVSSPSHPEAKTQSIFRLPGVPDHSLYKSDPGRANPTARVFTRKAAVEKAMRWYTSSGVNCVRAAVDSGISKVDWDALPVLVHPLHGGRLPASRAEKKCQQLENVAGAVLMLASQRSSENLTIVDFCSGGGHISILLSYLLPSATLIMVENKAESLERAMLRARDLGLKNCRFFQGNLDYFDATFDIGVSLHACGVATDLVIRSCVQRNADFVCCPCCYGSVRENHVLSYPRSKLFRHNNLTFENYLVIGHTADQTHFENDKHEQGSLAMDIIDNDRMQMALENGYKQVVLKKLNPPNCTPKNNLIVAKYRPR